MKTESYKNSDDDSARRAEHPSSHAELGCFKERLREAIGAGSVRGFASKSGLSQAALLSYLSGDTFPTLDRLAAIATAAERPMTWFLGSNDQPQVVSSQQLSGSDLTMAIQLAAEALDGRSMPPPEYAELVGLIYEGLTEGLPEAKILRFARLGARGAGGS